MKKDPLNNKLLERFPNLNENLGVFDLDTPATNFYEGIFVPYIIKNLNDINIMNNCFTFIEELLNGEESEQIIAYNAILCPLYERQINLDKLPLKPKALDYYLTWLKNAK